MFWHLDGSRTMGTVCISTTEIKKKSRIPSPFGTHPTSLALLGPQNAGTGHSKWPKLTPFFWIWLLLVALNTYIAFMRLVVMNHDGLQCPEAALKTPHAPFNGLLLVLCCGFGEETYLCSPFQCV